MGRQQRGDGGRGCGSIGWKDDALAGGEAIGLHHDGCSEVRSPGPRLSDILERRGAGTEDAVTLTERPGPRLRRLELCRCFGWSERLHPGGGERIGQAGFERGLGSDDDEFDRLGLTEGNDAVDVGGLQRNPRARSTRISRSDEQSGTQTRLGDLPCHGVLAPARTDNKNVHRSTPSKALLPPRGPSSMG